MRWQDLLFSYHGLVVTIVHDLILAGLLLIGILFVVQWYGVDISMRLPSIDHQIGSKR